MKTFQTVLLGIFGFFIVAGVIAIASYGKFGGGSSDGSVPAAGVVWGTLDGAVIESALTKYNQANDNTLGITYRQVSESTFDQELTTALAENRGPDMVLLTSDRLLQHERKIFAIPYENYPERTYRDTFTQGTELFLSPSGVLAFPILVDPMVLYWNRILLNAEGIVRPPQLWEEVLSLVPKLTKSDSSFNITQSIIALGEYENVTHAKEILATMIMQAGNPIVIRRGDGQYQSILNNTLNLPEAPADAALRFYTEFANPVKPAYSWNRSLPSSQTAFIRGDSALYLGFASELFDIQAQNPNLNFDVTRMPQVRDAVTKTTFGTMYAVAILNQSANKAGAFSAALTLANPGMVQYFVDAFALPPVRRDMLGQAPTDPFMTVFYQDALIAQGFFDPDRNQSAQVFKRLIEDVTSGRSSLSSAVSEASGRLNALF